MKRKFKGGLTSVSLPVFIADTSSTTGGGLSGVTSASSGLVLEYRRQGQSTWTSVTAVSKTLGTYTSGGIVADGSLAGAYEVDFPDAAFASGARMVLCRIRGVTNMLPVLIEIELDAVDYQDATAFGLSRIDAAVSSRMATYTQPTGFLAATFPTTVASPTNITAATGVVLSAVTHTGAVIPTVSTVTNGVTVTTNNDKTGYSLVAGTGLGNQTANITGNISGSVGSVTGNVGGSVASVTNAVTVGTLDAGVITFNAFDTDAINLNAIDGAVYAAIANAVAATQALSRLDSMIESDGAGQFRFDTIALSMGAGGGGSTDWTANERTAIRSILGIPTSGTTPTDPTVGILDTIRDTVGSIGLNVYPVSASTPERVSGTTLTFYLDESRSVSIVTDFTLTSMTLEFTVEDSRGNDVCVVADGSIVKSSQTATVPITSTVTGSLGQYAWSLRDITTGNSVIARGVLSVQNAASND